MRYEQFKYLQAPVLKNKIPPADLKNYETGEYIAQPILRGTTIVVFTNGDALHVYNDQGDRLGLLSNSSEFKRLSATGNWFVFIGQYLNKGYYDENKKKVRNNFTIWDIMVWNGEIISDKPLKHRLDLLNSLEVDFLAVSKIISYKLGFAEIFANTNPHNLYGGIIVKKLDSPLTDHAWIQCRKETKLYKF